MSNDQPEKQEAKQITWPANVKWLAPDESFFPTGGEIIHFGWDGDEPFIRYVEKVDEA